MLLLIGFNIGSTAHAVERQIQDASLISNIASSSGRSYVLADLAVGVQPYTDRTYKVTSVPASLAGAALVRTANDDKHSTSTSLLSFNLSESATVYVAYDPRATALPSWLSGWQKLTDRIGVDDSKISYMNIYSKSFPAGAVSLGGNKQSPATGAENNYFVLGKAAEAPAAGLISNISASSGRSYILGNLAAGAPFYTDRDYTVTSVPSTLDGMAFIRTANDDKNSTASSLLSFNLSESATVYVAYDPRATALPSWLSGWQKLTDRIGVDDSQISSMDLYSKSFPAGAVSLGGNKQSPAAGAQTNYFVVAKAAEAEQYTLSVSTTGSGTVTKSPNQATYASGTSVSLTATPASGYAFSGWSGDATGTSNPLSVTMGGNKTITANFTQSQPSTGLISNISASSGRSYILGSLAVGAQHYTDRTYKITSVPASLSGASLIRTANDDKKSTSSSLLSFNLSESATVYIAYDPRATALPSWLSGWQKLTDKIGVDDSQISSMDLYSKTFPAGAVSLGGNLQSPAAGAQTNYFVVAKAATVNTEQEVKINFQLATSTTPSGYIKDSGLPFDAGRGYGWVDPATKQPRDLSANMRERSGSVEARLRTLSQMQATTNGQVPGTWEYVVPNGSYNVSVSVGDPSYTDSRHQINVEGKAAINGFVPSSQALFQSATVSVNVSDGRLTVDAAGGTNTKLNYIIISPATAGEDIIPPVATVRFTGTEQSAGVYKNEVYVSVAASDEGGSGLASVQYSLNNAAYTAYTEPLRIGNPGNYTIRARATDNAGNETVTDVQNFSVVSATASNAYMVLENQNFFPAPDELSFSLIQNPWRRENSDGTFTPYNENHNKVKLRIHNKGTGALVISNFALSNPSAWKISKLNGAAYTASALPLSVASKSNVELEVEFIAANQATRVKVLQDALYISSNDDLAPYKEVKLRGLWQKYGEGNSEPYAQEIINALGFKTRIGFGASDGASDGSYVMPNSDEIISAYFQRVDPSKDVQVIQVAAYHGCCNDVENFEWHAKGSSYNTSLFTHENLDGQSLLPRKNGSTSLASGKIAVPTATTANPNAAFGFRVHKSYSDRTKNDGGKIGMRIWKAVDGNGNVIPNAYLIGADYLGTSYTNYDYQDNIYYISNVKPEAGPVHYSELGATPTTDFDFGAVMTGASKSLTINLKNLGGNYAGGSDPDIQIQKVEIVGPNMADFTTTAPATTTLAAQASTSVTVNFSPGSLGIKNAALLVYYNNATSPLRVPLYGIANSNSATITAVKRIKGAADSNVTIGGKVWEADASYRQGSIKLDKQIVSTAIAATDDDVLYQTYLSAGANLAETRYEIPLANGSYMVRMHFVENYWSATGSRVFNITAENQLRLPNFDIYSEVGYRSAMVKDFDINVSDGVLSLKFNPTADRLAIAAVEIYRATASGALAATSVEANVMQLAEGSKAALRVYPNPTSGGQVYAEISNFGAREAVTVTLHDVLGRAIASVDAVTDQQGYARVEVPGHTQLKRGMYIIRASAAGGKAQARLLIQ
ncbi:malectin domain-containing carbohydrate-binding protein [Pontibacter russatus]|uniref:malectin domain-containing carbohydrate-binding protein n=1 Tax=Pontibacter russatus TaxID=2694929 RepID=UPI00192A2C05|nr:malectin domain-containing carbohydrate-binding protein [Pontibacter russatus]